MLAPCRCLLPLGCGKGWEGVVGSPKKRLGFQKGGCLRSQELLSPLWPFDFGQVIGVTRQQRGLEFPSVL